MTINRLFQILALVVLFLCFGVFGYYHINQRDRVASLILDSLRDDVSQLTYVLSRNLSTGQRFTLQRPLLDRAASGNDFIAAIALKEGNAVLVSTDPLQQFSSGMPIDLSGVDYSQPLFSPVRYYSGAQLNELSLVIVPDQTEINRFLEISRTESIQYFVLFPIVLLLIVSYIVRSKVSKPLTRLRQFAYYHDQVPEAMTIRELDSIRRTLRDTFARLESEQKALYEQARIDALSGLSNRNALQEYVLALIAESRRTGSEFAMVFLDFDNFKSVNDSLGHEVGDDVIKEAGQRLRLAVRDYDLVARVGGDEFVIILKVFNNKEELALTVRRIQQKLGGAPIPGPAQIHVASSAGIAIFPHDGEDFVSLLKNADIAMFEAKDQQKGGMRFFSEATNQRVQRNIALDNAIRKALVAGEFELYYQPKINLLNGHIEGCEALIRWIRPDGVIIGPDDFIPIAEGNGFIVDLGDWVLSAAAKQLACWRDQGIMLRMAVNIATKQLLHDRFETRLLELLADYKLTPDQIDLEITEYVFFEQTRQNRALVDKLHKSGFTLCLDDFGTGYSSLSYLKLFAIDEIKIDKGFVADYLSPTGSVFIESIIKLGQALGKRVVAEGVETREQLHYLKQKGCNAVQGYYFSKPLNCSDFELYYKEFSGL